MTKKRKPTVGGSTRGLPSRETFNELMFAVHNIGQDVTSDDERGQASIEAAMQTSSVIYSLIETSVAMATTRKAKLGVVDGVVTALRLMAETTCAKEPEAYAKAEAKRGLAGDRHDCYGAKIVLPSECSETAAVGS